ncbi:response regulator transcription factor [Patescibacteria group bacterium]|nr:response regulator transcription factor [Patescibacteria group bacterium]
MKKSVLIVEDDALLAEVYQKSLKAEGISAVVANDFFDALAEFRPGQHSLIVLDIMLGEKNGFELLKTLRRQPGGDRFSVMIVTGLNTDELNMNKELMVGLNIVGIYTKSQFSIAQFVGLVKHHSRAK